MTKYIVFLICSFCSLANAFSQVNVTAVADSTNTFIGSRVTIELKLTGSKNDKYIFPQISDTLEKLIIINRSLIDTNYNGNTIELKQKLYLTCFDSGACVFPSLTFFSQQNGGMLMPFYSNSINLNFKAIDISKMKDIESIKPIYEAKSNSKLIIIISVVALVLAIVLILVYLHFKRKNNQPIYGPKISVPTIEPKVFAINELNILKSRQLWLNKEYKEHFTVLTDTIRRYIELKYNIPAMESVSYELINDYEAKTAKKEAVNVLKDIFAIGDLVKFAKYQPNDNQCNDCLTLAFKFIELNELTNSIDI